MLKGQNTGLFANGHWSKQATVFVKESFKK